MNYGWFADGPTGGWFIDGWFLEDPAMAATIVNYSYYANYGEVK